MSAEEECGAGDSRRCVSMCVAPAVTVAWCGCRVGGECVDASPSTEATLQSAVRLVAAVGRRRKVRALMDGCAHIVV